MTTQRKRTPLERLTLLDQAQQWLCGHGYTAIGLDHYNLAEDSLALAAKDGRLHRNFQGCTTGGEHDVQGLGPSARGVGAAPADPRCDVSVSDPL
jgi:coproporphyrinogen III oxidase-like Fe-S oxidoreductase